MPIKFKCSQCQNVLTVPDNLAGKKGKCPKCQSTLQVPVPKVAGAQAAKSPAATPAAAPAAFDPRMHELLNEVGVVHKTGPVCPKCQKDIQPGVVICVSCGFNLQTGQVMVGYDAKINRPEFDNEHLNLAVENMHRDNAMEDRRERAQMPWWVLASYLIGALVLCGAGVILVDGNFGTPAPETTTLGRLQRLPVLVVLGSTAGIMGLALALFAHLSICIYGFMQKASTGALCFFLPFIYSLPFGIMNWKNNQAPVRGMIMALVFIGIGTGLIVWGGGFGHLRGVI
jgi:phage FluMu protein Com